MRLASRNRDVRSLENWTDNSGCLAREETAYLSQKDDLMALSTASTDYADCILEAFVEDAIIWTKRMTRLVSTKCWCRL